MNEQRARLQAAARVDDRAERTLRTAAAISAGLRAVAGDPVLVGGGAVEIYTRSAYTTRDLDFVAPTTPELTEAMAALGFVREGRSWIDDQLALVVEFPSAVLAPAEAVSIDVDGDRLMVISVEDLIVDRLASWKHWGWSPDGAAAVLLLALHTDLDGARLQERAAAEDVTDALRVLGPLADQSQAVTDRQLRHARALRWARS